MQFEASPFELNGQQIEYFEKKKKSEMKLPVRKAPILLKIDRLRLVCL